MVANRSKERRFLCTVLGEVQSLINLWIIKQVSSMEKFLELSGIALSWREWRFHFGINKCKEAFSLCVVPTVLLQYYKGGRAPYYSVQYYKGGRAPWKVMIAWLLYLIYAAITLERKRCCLEWIPRFPSCVFTLERKRFHLEIGLQPILERRR